MQTMNPILVAGQELIKYRKMLDAQPEKDDEKYELANTLQRAWKNIFYDVLQPSVRSKIVGILEDELTNGNMELSHLCEQCNDDFGLITGTLLFGHSMSI